MKMLATTLALALTMGVAAAFAHGGNDHVRGTITGISPQSLTVRTQANTTRTLVVTSKTTFARSGQKAGLGDLKIGDRVVVDVPKDSNQALSVQFGPPPAKAAPHGGHERHE